MEHGELERLFQAFRDQGDVQRLGAVFDRSAPELLEIAVHLSGNVAEAEDLVQATFVVAIERASSWDSSQRLMPWLLGILARNAARARRDAGREPDAARMSERRATEPPEASSAAETRERLASAIAALPSPYREVLERHLLDDRRAVEVAREMSRAPGTVRMQILRGLELLRRSLPPSVATGLLLADELRGLAAVRAAVLDTAAVAAKASVVGAASGSSVAVGGALVSSKVVISLALAASLVAGASWWLVGSAKQAAPPHELAATTAPIAGELSEPAAPPREERARDERRPAIDVAADQASKSGVWLVGEIRGFDVELHTVPTISVFATGTDSHGLAVSVPPDGHYQIEVTQLLQVGEHALPGSLSVEVKHPTCQTANAVVAVDTGSLGDVANQRVEIRQDFELVPLCFIAGRIVLPAGMSAPEIGVSLFRASDDGAPAGEGLDEMEPEVDGTYSFRIRTLGSYRIVATCDGLVPASCTVKVSSKGVVHAPDLVLATGEIAICGWVRWPLRIDVGGVSVVARRLGHDDTHQRSLAWDGERFLALNQQALTDASGRFCIGGLAPGAYAVSIDGAPGIDHRVRLPSLEVIAPASDVVLGENVGRIAIDVLADGAPLANAKVQIVDEGSRWGAKVNASGHCAFLVNATRDCAVQASETGYSIGTRELPAAGRALDEHVELAIHRLAATDATLELVPTFGDGDNPASVRAIFRMIDESPLDWMIFSRAQPTASLVDGAYSFEHLSPGRYHVAVEPNESSHGFVPRGSDVRCDEFEIDLKPGETLRHSIDFERGGRLRLLVEEFAGGEVEQTCEILDANGQSVAVHFVTYSYEGDRITTGSSTGATSLTESAETYPTLTPGRYAVRLAVTGYRTIERDVAVRAGETTDVHLRLERE